MAIRRIEQVSCSLNLGLIYSVGYSWSPESGVQMTVYFVNQNGTYSKPQFMQKAFIRLGSASFSLYVVASKLSLGPGRRTMEVTFIDDTFKLDWYWVCLEGKGCGYNVYPLGRPVDRRSVLERQQDALDSSAQQIADFTQFPDIEYSFNDFLTVLRQKFTVVVNTSYDTTLTNIFTGTFRDVLGQWCSFYNLSYFFENGSLKIFDPTRLNINLPTQGSINDIIEWEEEEDIRDTYGKTVFNWFQQEGEQFSLNQTSDEDGALLVRTDTLYPVGYEFGLSQPAMDLNQVAAAQYGEQFWFLYNYVKGTTTEQCGWTPLSASNSAQAGVISSLSAAGARAVIQNNDVYQGRFEAYQAYGQTLAGRIYLSNEKNDLAIDKNYTWFDESQGQIFSFTDVDDKAMNLEFLTPTSSSVNKVPNTIINAYYPGVNYIGNRIVYFDTAPISGNFSLGNLNVGTTYEQIFQLDGSKSFDFSPFASSANGTSIITAYNPNISIPQEIVSLINDIPNKTSVFNPRFSSIPIKGITQSDYSSLKASQSEPDDIDIIEGSEGPNVIGNTAVIKTEKQGAYTAYTNKYSKCGSAHSTGPYFGHRFDPRQVSVDNTILYSFTKGANNTYTINRDFSTIERLVNNPAMSSLAEARSFLTKRITFTVNYFRDIPVSFLTNGLVGMSISVAGDGVSCTYTFSNEVLAVPDGENEFAKFEQMIRNSAIRQYRPNQVIS